MPAAWTAMPVKPSTPAIMAITRKISTHLMHDLIPFEIILDV